MTKEKTGGIGRSGIQHEDVIYEDAHQKIYTLSVKISGVKRTYCVRGSGVRAGVVVARGDSIY